jgi:UDP-N-acetylglucosamine--dolichyl-phosphate N-acetylglucosaminephosphotransferase
VSAAAFVLTLRLVPVVASKTLRRGLSGLDINKRGTPAGEVPIPEAAGLAAGAAFLIASLVFQWLQHTVGTLPQGATSPAHAALVCVLAALFLGFVDDVLDVPWRVKLAMPTLASLPLLMAYTGHTGVVVPHLLRPALGGQAFLDLGILYKLYMLAVSVFCTNSINILAGVNGLEAGQTLVLALACAAHSLRQLCNLAAWPPVDAAAKLQAHALSLSLVLPLAAVSAGILCFNWCVRRG